MTGNLPRLIEQFRGLNLIVIGEAMLDVYLSGDASRLSQEAPVPVVALSGRTNAPGGAANTAANVAALGGNVTLLSATGDDPEGTILRTELRGRGVITDAVLVRPERGTLAKQRLFAGAQMLVRFDQGCTEPLAPAAESALIAELTALHPHCHAIVVSDYGYGILTPRVIEALAALQAKAPRPLVVDARDLTRYRAAGVTAVKPNFREAMSLLGLPEQEPGCDRVSRTIAQGDRLLDITGAEIVAVTLDADGALALERGRPPYRTYARQAHPGRTAGAGDTYLAALALALAAKAPLPAAAELAAAAANVAAGHGGTAACTNGELLSAVTAGEKQLPDRDTLAACVAAARREGRRIVFTNGCFDIIHRGHVTYLSRAKALGDVLVVGVNSDESVRRLKGPDRPINGIDDRLGVLAALSCVDYVISFEEESPDALISAVRPDVFVKGGDYTRATLPEASLVERLGGEVQILAFVEDQSTTGIIERIAASHGRRNGNGHHAAQVVQS